MKKLIFILLIVAVAGQAYAMSVATTTAMMGAAVASGNNAREAARERAEAREVRSYCTPPYSFALENKCLLAYRGDRTTKEYLCRVDGNHHWELEAFCDGTVYSSEFRDTTLTNTDKVLLGAVIGLWVLFFIWFMWVIV